MSFQAETKTRRILGHWQGASEAHTRNGLPRASNAASGTKDQRISLSLKAIWNKSGVPPFSPAPAERHVYSNRPTNKILSSVGAA